MASPASTLTPARRKAFAAFTFLCVIVCLSLGGWQIKRLFWKQQLIAAVERNLVMDAVEIPPLTELTANQYLKVRLHGSADLSRRMFFGEYYDNRWGYKLVAPVMLERGGAVYAILGWLPEDDRKIWEDKILADVTINAEGIIRLANRKGWFTPDNDMKRNYWFWYDSNAMNEYSKTSAPPVVVELIVTKETPPIGDLKIPSKKPQLLNDHLHYAITWLLMAAAITGMYIIYIRKNAV